MMEALKDLCRSRLLASGFREATKYPGYYYRPDTQYTAYFVNFKNRGARLGICYGLASTAFTRMAGCENVLTEYGILNEDACIRGFLYLTDPCDLDETEALIRQQLVPYEGLSKDELLTLVRDRKKAFLNDIHSVLKGAGFRRKGTLWTLCYSDDYILQFRADKSSFCDYYRFIVTIESRRKKVQSFSWCSNYVYQPSREESFDPDSAFRFDWQVNTREDLMKHLNDFLREYVEPVKQGGMEALGKMDYIKERCICSRDCCDGCWINP